MPYKNESFFREDFTSYNEEENTLHWKEKEEREDTRTKKKREWGNYIRVI